MRVASFILILSLGLNASANSFISKCSTPDGTVVYNVAPFKSELFVSLINSDESIEKVALNNFNIESISMVNLESTIKNTCDLAFNGQGILETMDLNFRKVKITLDDDKLFAENVIGVSEDFKSLEVDYICRTEISQTIDCK